MNWIILFSIFGLAASLYAFYLERKVSKDANYKAACDINDRMSCTKAITSSYGKVFGISNGAIGILFYTFIIAIVIFGYGNYVFHLAILSILGSIYLWYVLTFKVKAICVVCYTIYAVNIALLIASYLAR